MQRADFCTRPCRSTYFACVGCYLYHTSSFRNTRASWAYLRLSRLRKYKSFTTRTLNIVTINIFQLYFHFYINSLCGYNLVDLSALPTASSPPYPLSTVATVNTITKTSFKRLLGCYNSISNTNLTYNTDHTNAFSVIGRFT